MASVDFWGKPLTFNANTHRYKWGDEYVPNVTTIVGRLNKPFIPQWYADTAVDSLVQQIRSATDGATVDVDKAAAIAKAAPSSKRDAAGDIGTILHNYAEAVLTGKPPPRITDERARHACMGFDLWIIENKVEPIAMERFVFSRSGPYAGTLDLYAYVNRTPTVVDIKSGKAIYDEAWFQVAGYDEALTDELKINALSHAIVHLNKETGELNAEVRGPDHIKVEHARTVWRALLKLDQSIRAFTSKKRRERREDGH